jgi:long-chain acyl-CoA synthetase
MQLTQGLRRSRNLFPKRLATVFGARTATWEVFADRVARLAAGLRARGVSPGDRVAILALNSDRYVEAYYAIAWAGAVAVPFNTRWANAEIEFAMTDSEPALAMVDAAFAHHARTFAAAGIPVIAMDDADGPDAQDNIIARETPIADQCGPGDTLAGIFYTGGTTGRSKGVMLSHANLVINFLMVQAVAPYEANSIFLHTPPMFHLADAGCLFGLTNIGATHVVLPGFEVGATLRAIEQHRVTSLILVPTMIGMVCEALRTQPADVTSVSRLTYGASPISAAVLERAMEAFPNARFVQAYGQTELSPVATALEHEDHLAGRLKSAGRAVPGSDVRVVDETMTTRPTGEVGEIVVRGPHVMQGYWRRPDLTAETIIDGWLRTGDAGYLDETGYLHLVDRVKDMIVSGGENVYSAEVEHALMRHPDVLQCAVIGVPDDRWGERVHAVLCIREGANVMDADLSAHLEPLIANYKRPKSFDIRTTPLPLSGVGKILKTELRQPYWAGRSRNIG